MKINRVVPNIQTEHVEKTKQFFHDFLGMDIGMDMGWIITLVSANTPTAQVSILQKQEEGDDMPVSLSIEVDDVDAAHALATDRGYNIIYPLTDEPWGVRRFHVLDPNGLTINIMSHGKSNDDHTNNG